MQGQDIAETGAEDPRSRSGIRGVSETSTRPAKLAMMAQTITGIARPRSIYLAAGMVKSTAAIRPAPAGPASV